MKLNKLERHTAYIIMLAEAETLSEAFLCNIANRLGIIDNSRDVYFEDLLPELYRKKPKKCYTHTTWFPSFELGKRIKLLKQCIEETY